MFSTAVLFLALLAPGQAQRPGRVAPPTTPAKSQPRAVAAPVAHQPAASLATGMPLTSHEFVAAATDRARFPVEDQCFLFYFSTMSYHPDYRSVAEHSLYFVVASLSHKTDLQYQLPVKVSETLYRIDLRGLGWEQVWHAAIVKHYPFKWKDDLNQKFYSPLVIRADWFIGDGYDETRTADFQYQLLYSGKVPATREDYLAFWGVALNDPEYIFGMIEGESGVATQKIRQIESQPTSKRGYSYFTKDARKIAGKTDPLENLPNGAKFDAQEFIVGMYKIRNGRSGNLQSYFLSDANGKRQAKAPVDIVEDKTNTRGREIANSASCVYCHTSGILPPTKNEYVTFIKDRTRLYNDLETRYKIERFHGSDLAKEIRLNQQAYSDGIQIVNGLTAGQNSRHFQISVQIYIGQATLDGVARELAILYGDRLDGTELRKILGYASLQGRLTGRLAALAEGRTISRDMVNENFFQLQEAIILWNAKSK